MPAETTDKPKKTLPPRDSIKGLPEGASMIWVGENLYVAFRYAKTPTGKRPVVYIGKVIDSTFYPDAEYAAHPENFPRPQRYKPGRHPKGQPATPVAPEPATEDVFSGKVINVEAGVPALLLAAGDAENIFSDLTEAMTKVFADKPELLPMVKTVAMFVASTGYSTWRIDEWCLQTLTPTNLISQRVSELFIALGERMAQLKSALATRRLARFFERNRRREFLKNKGKRGKLSAEDAAELKQLGEHEFIAHDGTKLYSDARQLTFSQMGVSKAGEFCNLVTLSLLHSSSDGIPVTYEIRPGNLNDTETISDVQSLCDAFSIPADKVWTVVDRNYSSAENLTNCKNLDMTTIAAVSMSNMYVQDLRDRRASELKSNRTYNLNFRLHGLSEKVLLPTGTEVTVCLFLKARNREEARQKLMSKIEQFKVLWIGEKGKDKVDKKMMKFFSKLEEGKTPIEDWDAIDKEVDTRGLFALACTKEMSCWEALRAYKTRNCVEVAFKSGKQHLNLESVRVHRDLVLQGKMFVNFVGLMLIAAVQKRLTYWKMTPKRVAAVPLNRNLSYAKLLDKVKCVRLVKAATGNATLEGVTETVTAIVEQLRLPDAFDLQKIKDRTFKL